MKLETKGNLMIAAVVAQVAIYIATAGTVIYITVHFLRKVW